jgi:hypothetical protein
MVDLRRRQKQKLHWSSRQVPQIFLFDFHKIWSLPTNIRKRLDIKLHGLSSSMSRTRVSRRTGGRI